MLDPSTLTAIVGIRMFWRKGNLHICMYGWMLMPGIKTIEIPAHS